jgi:hypothetical protein
MLVFVSGGSTQSFSRVGITGLAREFLPGWDNTLRA